MKKTIRDFDLKGKKVIIRCDFNVPINNGKIDDDNRIVESLETIEYALENGAKVILMSHLGRPKAEEDKKNNSLKPVSDRLRKLLGLKIQFVPVTRGEELENTIGQMEPGEVVLIENTRHEDIDGKKESNNDDELGKYWASFGDIFINDAYGVSHRSSASIVGIASHIPSGVGFLIEKELNIMLPAIQNPQRPFTVILGGSKVSDKARVVEHITEIADYILIGGGTSHTFLNAEGFNMGASRVEEHSKPEDKEQINYIEFCRNIVSKYPDKVILPVDIVVNTEFKDTKGTVKGINELDDNDIAMDIGPETAKIFVKYINESKSVIWAGPMGVFEFKNYNKGTKVVSEAMSQNKGITIVGGGDSASAVINLGYKEKFTHISTGGGASLKLLEGKTLPGIEVINEKE